MSIQGINLCPKPTGEIVRYANDDKPEPNHAIFQVTSADEKECWYVDPSGP